MNLKKVLVACTLAGSIVQIIYHPYLFIPICILFLGLLYE